MAQSFHEATDLAEIIARAEAPDFDFERLDGYLYCLPGQDPKILEGEWVAATQAGVAVDRLPQMPGLAFNTGPYGRLFRQAQFHPQRYLAGLAKACVRRGMHIPCGTQAQNIASTSHAQIVTKLAVFRDPAFALHVRSAICPHLGCVVAWNPAKKSWDCPCHDVKVWRRRRGARRAGGVGTGRSPAGSAARQLNLPGS